MRFPAEKARRPRTVIQWQDDTSEPRVRSFLSEDIPPFRALGLAAVMGVLSIAAVVATIQIQREGGIADEVGSLVEQARAGNLASARVAPEAPVTAAEQPASVKLEEPKPENLTLASPAEPPSDLPGVTVGTPVGPADEPAEASRPAARVDVADAQLQPVEDIELEPLTKNDPRWIHVDTVPISVHAADLSRMARLAEQPMALTPAGSPVVVAEPEPVAVAEPEPEPAQEIEPQKVASIEKAPTSLAVGFDTGSSNARVKTAVFLRARPADGSKIIVTIPGGAAIQAPASCKHWCQVSYQGRRGFIYKSFVLR